MFLSFWLRSACFDSEYSKSNVYHVFVSLKCANQNLLLTNQGPLPIRFLCCGQISRFDIFSSQVRAKPKVDNRKNNNYGHFSGLILAKILDILGMCVQYLQHILKIGCSQLLHLVCQFLALFRGGSRNPTTVIMRLARICCQCYQHHAMAGSRHCSHLSRVGLSLTIGINSAKTPYGI